MTGLELESGTAAPFNVDDFPTHIKALLAGPGHARSYEEARIVVAAGLDFIRQRGKIRNWKPRDIIYWQGYEASKVFMMQRGFAYTAKDDENANGHVLEIIGAPTIIGGDIFHGSPTYEHSLRTLTECTTRSVLISALHATGERAVLDFFLVNHLIHEHNRTVRFDALGDRSTVAVRLALTLLDLSGRREPFPFQRLTQEQLAGLALATRESVNKEMAAFRNAQIASVGRVAKPIIVNGEKLRKVASGELRPHHR